MASPAQAEYTRVSDVGRAPDPLGQLFERGPDAFDSDELASVLFGLVDVCPAISVPPAETQVVTGDDLQLVFPSKTMDVRFVAGEPDRAECSELVAELGPGPSADEVLLITTRPLSSQTKQEIDARPDVHYIELVRSIQWAEDADS